MKQTVTILCFFTLIVLFISCFSNTGSREGNQKSKSSYSNSTDYDYDDDERILAYTVDTKTQNLQLYLKNDKGEFIHSIQNLKTYVRVKT